MNSKLIQKLKLDRYISHWIILLIDVLVSVLCSLFACLVVEYLAPGVISGSSFLYMLLASLGASIVAFYVWGTYKNTIRHTSLKDTWRLSVAAITKVIIIYFTCDFYRLIVSEKLLLLEVCIDLLLTAILLYIVRILVLVTYDAINARYSLQKKIRNILIYGAENASVALAMRFKNNSESKYTVSGFLTFGSRYKSLRVAGYKVFYFEDADSLRFVAKENDIHAVVFSDYNAAKEEKDRLIRYCESNNIQVLMAPPVDEIKDGELPHQNIRKIRIEDLLGRDEIEVNMEKIIAAFKDRTILVTGAAGSIGSELCRQLATFGVKNLILFDSAETPMHTIRLELEERFPELEFIPVIGDIRIKARLDMVFNRYKPQLVFHAAAYKHVPLMEENPCEAVFVNVSGTRHVADLCVEHEVEKMIMISTDKAVNPTNIMGASKRLAEIYVQSLGLAIEAGKIKGKTQFVTTRFGNVLGSNGSVLVRFREQIEKGGPVTVTHPDIIRYFMTIPEACRLVMEAATIGHANEIYVFEMGEPVRIAYLAERMIELAGFTPNKDIKIEYTGLRPGEKLYEEMLSNEENTIPTSHKKIRIAKIRDYDYAEVNEAVSTLTRLSASVMIPDTVKLMKQVVPEFKSKNSRFEKYDKENEEQNKPVRIV